MIAEIDPDIDKVLAWLTSIGLQVERGSRPWQNLFAEGIWIEEGRLIVSADAMVGDLLHEAGHLAVLPSRFRKLVSGDIDDLWGERAELVSSVTERLGQWPEDSEARALMQASDHETIAWSFAAALEVGVDPTLPFLRGFKNDGQAEAIYMACCDKQYIGINGLRAAGFINAIGNFPILKKWVQP